MGPRSSSWTKSYFSEPHAVMTLGQSKLGLTLEIYSS